MHRISPRNLVKELLRTQALVTVITVALAALFFGLRAAIGVFIGGGIGLLLTAVFALRSFALPTGATAQQIVGAMYKAAATKLVLAVILFVLVARFAAEYFGGVMTGYIVTFVAYWVAGMRSSVSNHHQEKG